MDWRLFMSRSLLASLLFLTETRSQAQKPAQKDLKPNGQRPAI
ncbi:Alpha-galactosidase [Lacticaseibacillus paracasei]|nr:Alpha-galactosidase [Lacticaseibacillus paracasei]OUC71527.1 hypothetical protein BWK52_1581 [Lacticaseibacillus paracasei]